MKDVSREIEYNGRKYKLVFNLNVMEAIQEEYGTFEKWGDLTEGKTEDGDKKEPNIKAIVFGVTQMLNEGIDIENEENGTDEKPFTHKQVGRIIMDVGMAEVADQMKETVVASTESTEKNV